MIHLIQHLALPPNQSLSTLKPTPSTVSFTVTTQPVAETLAAVLGRYVSLLFRVLIGTVSIVLVIFKWQASSARHWLPLLLPSSEIGIANNLESTPWKYLGPAVLALLWFVSRRGYTEESLLILQGLGLQTSTSSSTYLQSATTRFIPTASIQDMFIHEAFIGFEVRFYLAIVVRGEEDVVVVFPTLLPRRAILENVWRGAKACLYEETGSSKGVGK